MFFAVGTMLKQKDIAFKNFLMDRIAMVLDCKLCIITHTSDDNSTVGRKSPNFIWGKVC